MHQGGEKGSRESFLCSLRFTLCAAICRSAERPALTAAAFRGGGVVGWGGSSVGQMI